MEVVMKKVLLVSVIALGFAALGLAADDASLVQTLAGQLNVSEEQAAGGAGAIFNYAKSSLPSNEYAKVEGAVPEAAELVKKAPTTDSTASAAASALGKAGGTAAGIASLGSSFQKLGLSSDMVGKFVPVVVDYVDKKGGSEAGGILKKVLVSDTK
jgi:hypothetical protein